MSIISVPYHLDELLADLKRSLPDDVDAAEVTVRLPDADVWARLGALYEAVADSVERATRADSVPVVVSGDCTVSIGMTAGLQRAGIDPAIVWIDAHGDLQTLETTPSGYLGGMALQVLLGYRPDLVAERLGLRPPSEARVLLVDARDLDPAEIDYLATAPVRRLTVGEVTADALPDGPLLLNLDLDVLDPTALPGLRYPAPGGPDLAAVLGVVRTVVDSSRLAGVNIACTWQPSDGESDDRRERVVSDVLRGTHLT